MTRPTPPTPPPTPHPSSTPPPTPPPSAPPPFAPPPVSPPSAPPPAQIPPPAPSAPPSASPSARSRQLYKEAFVASLLVLSVDFLLSFLPWKFELIKPIKQGFNDFNVYDLRYAGADSLISTKDTDITLLEIGNDRRQIAEEIARVSALHPRVIGVDAMFYQPSAVPADDSALIDAMRAAPHLVLASRLAPALPADPTTHPDTLAENASAGPTSHPSPPAGQANPPATRIQKSFLQSRLPSARDGFFDFVEGPEDIRRHVKPFEPIDTQRYPSLPVRYPSLPVRMLQEIDPQAYDTLVKRRNQYEMINYAGNLSHYNTVSLKRFLHPQDESDLAGYFRDKIVFIGFFKDELPDVLEDMHFTPMNPKRGGKSFPDTYGVVIHANVLEMMMKDNYIHELPVGTVYLITFFLIFCINVLYIRRISRHRGHSEFFLFLLQFILAIGLLYLALLLFDRFDLAFDPMPLLIAVVLSFEIFWLYEWLARRLNKYFKYATFLADTDHPADHPAEHPAH
jgi:CHASE2 domain-containing sensor protein